MPWVPRLVIFQKSANDGGSVIPGAENNVIGIWIIKTVLLDVKFEVIVDTPAVATSPVAIFAIVFHLNYMPVDHFLLHESDIAADCVTVLPITYVLV